MKQRPTLPVGYRWLYSPGLLQKALIHALIIVFFMILVFFRGTRIGYPWQWSGAVHYLFNEAQGGVSFLRGVGMTLYASLMALVIALAAGTLATLLRYSSSLLAGIVGGAFVQVFRNTPLLIQISLFYFALAPFLNINSFIMAILAVGLFEGAYTAEILRAAINAIPAGQWESARSLGLPGWVIMFKIILPQAIRKSIPLFVSQGVSLVKDTSLLFIAAIAELTYSANIIAAQTHMVFEVWIIAALFYLTINVTISSVAEQFGKGKVNNE